MRVVHVGLESTATRPGGLNRYLAALLAAERRAGIDAAAVVLADGGPLDDAMHAVSTHGSVWARARRVDRAVASLGRVDVADVHFAGTAVVAVVAGALRRTPVVVHFQGPWADESLAAGGHRPAATAKRLIERAVYRRAARFVVLSDAFAATLEGRYGVAPWLVDVIAPGVDLDRFAPGDRAAARREAGLSQGRVVVSVRRLVPRMGLDVLVRAWHAAAPAVDDRLVIVGEGPERASLHELATSLGVAATVELRGAVGDDALVSLYRAADVTVVPSVALEGYGLVVLESLACGTPVIGTDAGGLAQAIEALGQGPCVAAGDVDGLAARLRAALAAPEGLPSAASCRAAAAAHGWAEVAHRHEDLYRLAMRHDATLRVVVLDHTSVLSGGELAIARAISGLGADVSVHAILATDGPLRARLEAVGATVEILELDPVARTVARGDVRAGSLRPRAIAAAARHVVVLARRLRQLRPDVVHTNSLKAALYGGVAARLAGVPCVWHVRDRIEVPYLPTTAVRVVRAAARTLPAAIVANSASTLSTLGIRDGTVVPSPLDPSIPLATTRSAAGPTLRVAMVGRLAEWKGQRLAIDAFVEAFGDRSATLAIAGTAMFGEDAYEAALQAHVADAGLAARVSFLGFVDDVAGLYETTDIVVHASLLAEPFGQVVIEAMGAGCAVVVADGGGPAEVVTDGLDGVVYPRGDVHALATALRALGDDAALRARLGAAARATAASYTPVALAPMLVGVWRSAAARGHPRSRHRGHRRG